MDQRWAPARCRLQHARLESSLAAVRADGDDVVHGVVPPPHRGCQAVLLDRLTQKVLAAEDAVEPMLAHSV
ncbi:hypothetical protein [Luteococcus sediminum]